MATTYEAKEVQRVLRANDGSNSFRLTVSAADGTTSKVLNIDPWTMVQLAVLLDNGTARVVTDNVG